MIFKKGKLVSSYTQIDLFLGCPFRWYTKYVKKISMDEKAKALEYGLTIHETLEYYFEKLREGNRPELSELIAAYEMLFELYQIPFDSPEEELEFKLEGLVMIQRLYNPINEVEELFNNAEIIGVEMPFEIAIPIPPMKVKYIDENGEEQEEEQDTVYIIGFIDLVLKTDEGIIVIDHKSGKTLYKKDKLETNLQFPIYAMAVLKEYEELPVKYYYNFTRVHKFQEVYIDEERLEYSKQEIVKVFKKMGKPKINEDGTLKFTASPNFLCGWCDFGNKALAICEAHKKHEKAGQYKKKGK